MLTLLIFIPILAAAAVLLGAPARKTSLLAAAVNFFLTLVALAKFKSGAGFQFVSSVSILPDWNLNFLVGADGLSLLMLLLTTIVTVAAICVTPPVEKMEKQFYASL